MKTPLPIPQTCTWLPVGTLMLVRMGTYYDVEIPGKGVQRVEVEPARVVLVENIGQNPVDSPKS